MKRRILIYLTLVVAFTSGFAQSPQTDTIPERGDTSVIQTDTVPVADTSSIVTDTIPAQLTAFAPTADSIVQRRVLTNAMLKDNFLKYRAEGQPIYRLKPAVDVPLTLAFAGWSLYGFTKIYNKTPSTTEEVENLRISDINGFDRWAADVYSEKADAISDIPFYAAMPLPLVLMLDKSIRKDALKVGFLYIEAMAITGLLYTGTAYLVDRYRPGTYNPKVPIDERRGGNQKNSFFAGHVALVATSSFFVAKTYADYHPTSGFRHVLYGAAALTTGATAYLRHKGGKHFPSDIVVGTAIGTLTGILVPHVHKNKVYNKKNIVFLPYIGESGGTGMTALYRF